MSLATLRLPPVGSPWSRHDAVTASAVMVVGAATWIAGWWQVAHGVLMDEQMAPLNVAVVGFLLIGAGQTWFFMRGRRAVRRRREVLLAAYSAMPVAVETLLEADRYVGGPRFYHRIECSLATGRDWTVGPRAEQENAGRTACGVCRP